MLDDSKDDESSLRWRIVNRHHFMQAKAKVKCATYHVGSDLLVAGFSNGLFGLYKLPEFDMIHTLRLILYSSFNHVKHADITAAYLKVT